MQYRKLFNTRTRQKCFNNRSFNHTNLATSNYNLKSKQLRHYERLTTKHYRKYKKQLLADILKLLVLLPNSLGVSGN